MAVTKELSIGSGKLFMKKVTDETEIPALKAICTDANQIALVKGGFTVEYSLDTKEIYDDLRVVNETFITGEHCKFTSGVITWDKAVIEALINNEEVGDDGEILVGAQGLTSMDKYVIIFEAVPSNKNVIRRFGCIGVCSSGLKMAYNPDDANTVDIEFDSVADGNGHYLRIEEETVTA